MIRHLSLLLWALVASSATATMQLPPNTVLGFSAFEEK